MAVRTSQSPSSNDVNCGLLQADTRLDADAFFGMDDLREWCIRQKCSIPVYLNRPTYDTIAGAFPYMVDKSQASGGGDVYVNPNTTGN